MSIYKTSLKQCGPSQNQNRNVYPDQLLEEFWWRVLWEIEIRTTVCNLWVYTNDLILHVGDEPEWLLLNYGKRISCNLWAILCPVSKICLALCSLVWPDVSIFGRNVLGWLVCQLHTKSRTNASVLERYVGVFPDKPVHWSFCAESKSGCIPHRHIRFFFHLWTSVVSDSKEDSCYYRKVKCDDLHIVSYSSN